MYKDRYHHEVISNSSLCVYMTKHLEYMHIGKYNRLFLRTVKKYINCTMDVKVKILYMHINCMCIVFRLKNDIEIYVWIKPNEVSIVLFDNGCVLDDYLLKHFIESRKYEIIRAIGEGFEKYYNNKDIKLFTEMEGLRCENECL